MKSAALSANFREDDRMVEIYLKATRIFYEKGYDATSMSDLAAALNLTKAGLYYYVESKEDLLFKILNFALDWLDKEVIAPARDLRDPEERLRWVIRRHGRQLLEGSRSMSILTEEVLGLGPKHRQQILARQRSYFDLVHDAIVAMKTQGKIRDVDPTTATFSLFGMLFWLPRWVQAEGALSTDQILDNVSSLFFGGLMKPAALEASAKREPKG